MSLLLSVRGHKYLLNLKKQVYSNTNKLVTSGEAVLMWREAWGMLSLLWKVLFKSLKLKTSLLSLQFSKSSSLTTHRRGLSEVCMHKMLRWGASPASHFQHGCPASFITQTALKVCSLPLTGMVPQRARPGYTSEAFTPGAEFRGSLKNSIVKTDIFKNQN